MAAQFPGDALDKRLLTAMASIGLLAPNLVENIYDGKSALKIPRSPGAYALLLKMASPINMRLKSGNQIAIASGWLIYCGSAKGPGGLQARLARHFRTEKKPHWHVDHLTVQADMLSAIPLPGADECAIAQVLQHSSSFSPGPKGFGSSDCTLCTTHLWQFCG